MFSFYDLDDYQIERLKSNLESKLDKTAGPSGCWNWTGALSYAKRSPQHRYGTMRVPGTHKIVKPHRAAYFLNTMIDPGGWVIMHTCDNPRCCNPLHLQTGSNADNMRDMVQKGRHGGATRQDQTGENNGNAKLSDQDVHEIRNRLERGQTRALIAKDYPVSASMIGMIGAHKVWKHI